MKIFSQKTQQQSHTYQPDYMQFYPTQQSPSNAQKIKKQRILRFPWNLDSVLEKSSGSTGFVTKKIQTCRIFLQKHAPTHWLYRSCVEKSYRKSCKNSYREYHKPAWRILPFSSLNPKDYKPFEVPFVYSSPTLSTVLITLRHRIQLLMCIKQLLCKNLAIFRKLFIPLPRKLPWKSGAVHQKLPWKSGAAHQKLP